MNNYYKALIGLFNKKIKSLERKAGKKLRTDFTFVSQVYPQDYKDKLEYQQRLKWSKEGTLSPCLPFIIGILFYIIGFTLVIFQGDIFPWELGDFGFLLILFNMFIYTPISLILSPLCIHHRVKKRHEYGIYDKAQDAADYALASLMAKDCAKSIKSTGRWYKDIHNPSNRKI